jgi:hypothetical protein
VGSIPIRLPSQNNKNAQNERFFYYFTIFVYTFLLFYILPNMSLEITGRLIVKMPTQQIKESFKKREFVVETTEQYPQKIKLELTQDKCDILDTYKEGDVLKVSFNLRGSVWQEKYYVNLQAWRIQLDNASNSMPGTNTMETSAPASQNNSFAAASTEDDLPF